MNDREAIQKSALDYVEGWYEGDADRMERSLHPSLVKRALKSIPATEKAYLNYLTREEMVSATEGGGGTHVPKEARSYKISILDIYEEIACVRADNPDWVDYLHMVKLDGQWLIVNVLYTANRGGS